MLTKNELRSVVIPRTVIMSVSAKSVYANDATYDINSLVVFVATVPVGVDLGTNRIVFHHSFSSGLAK